MIISLRRGAYESAEPTEPAPCEMGCAWIEHCREKWVGCHSFKKYVRTNVTGKPWPADSPPPNLRIGIEEDM